MADRPRSGHPQGRKTKARVLVEMLQLAINELDAIKTERDPLRLEERALFVKRVLADALVSVNKWTALG